ncbi:SpoIIE family protein phosphatase [Streptomyces albus]|uniref:SpoIIE family protein phosphatase n=1 Tax=Streptomyces albus TaxID=1888 RepID=UPI00099D34E9|nr:SpoIIE family protein phosphatase [Streptomyces albus]
MRPAENTPGTAAGPGGPEDGGGTRPDGTGSAGTRPAGAAPGAAGPGAAAPGADDPALSALLDSDTADLYEHAPCGFLSTLLDGTIARINTTLLEWLGHTREQLVGHRRFSDLLTVGGRLYHETHFAPLLRLHGEARGIALELKRADGSRLPVLVTSVVKTGDDGRPLLIRTTVFDARDRRAYERELLRARREAEREHRRLRRLVTTLQRSLVPPALPPVPGLETAAHYRVASADEVGGDFYDLFPLTADRWGFFLGDVSGKGPEAAGVTSLIRYTLRAAAAHAPDARTVLTTLNSTLCQADQGTDPHFCTVLHGDLTPDGDGFRVTLASGGHPPALLLRADGTAAYLHTPGGLLVGVLPTAEFAVTTVRLGPGDTLLLYTDGLTEARTDTSGGRYGEDALLSFAAGLAPTGPGAAVTAVRALLDELGEGLEDDTAVLALGVPGAASGDGAGSGHGTADANGRATEPG